MKRFKDTSQMVFCACGCGQKRSKWRRISDPYDYEVAKYIKGHTNKGKHLSQKHKEKIGKSNSRPMSQRQRQLLSKIHKELYSSGKVENYWKGKINIALVNGRKKWNAQRKPLPAEKRFNGGKYLRKDGYWCIYDNSRNKSVLEHHYIMEQYLRRRLAPQEHVHHIDGDKANNIIDNLFLFPTNSAHVKFHSLYRKGILGDTDMEKCC